MRDNASGIEVQGGLKTSWIECVVSPRFLFIETKFKLLTVDVLVGSN